jgi:hypothetical protein
MRNERVTLTHRRVSLGESFRISNGVVAQKDGVPARVPAVVEEGYVA